MALSGGERGLKQREFAPADDVDARRLQTRRRQKHVVPSAAFGDREIEKGREPFLVDLGVVLEHAGEIETFVDDSPPGGAMA